MSFGVGASAAASATNGSESVCVSWMLPNRSLRDQLEPLLLINSNVALVTLTAKQLNIQVIDRFITSAFQRSFFNGVDYHLTQSDPLSEHVGDSKMADKKCDGILFDASVDLGGIHDILSGTTPSTMLLLGQPMKRTVQAKNDNDNGINNGNDDDTGLDACHDNGEEEDEDKEQEGGVKGKGSHRGRRSSGATAFANREEKVAWRFTTTRFGASSLDVKVRFITLQHPQPSSIILPTPQIQTHAFDTPMAKQQQQQQQHHNHTNPHHPANPQHPANSAFPHGGNMGDGPKLVAKMSGWEKVSIIGVAMVTPTIDFAPSFPPRFYRFEPLNYSGGWLNPSVGAKVSLRCTSDLQDDFMNLSTFSETCEMTITNGDMQLMAKSKRAKKVYVLRYEQPYEFDATPLITMTAPPAAAAVANKPQSGATAGKKKGAKKAAAQTPQPLSAQHALAPPVTPLPRRPVHNTPRFYVEYIRKNMVSPTIRCEFLLRSFRIIHKLIGSSSRIEWIIHHPNTPTPTAASSNSNTAVAASNPNAAAAAASNPNAAAAASNSNAAAAASRAAVAPLGAGPVICAFYQGTLAAERLVGVLMSLRLPAPRK